MTKKFQKDKKRKKIIVLFLTFCFLFSTLCWPIAVVAQSGPIQVTDQPQTAVTETGVVERAADWLKTDVWSKSIEALKESWAVALNTAIRNALNKIAYDTATWIGSGGEGQKPLFVTEGWGEYLKNIADEAAGDFLEGISDAFPIDLCNPGANVRLKIHLGLIQYARPSAPDCTFSKMKENWKEALDSKNFLNDIQDMFEPTSNDVGIAFEIQSRSGAYQLEMLSEGKLTRFLNKGWIPQSGIDDQQTEPPGEADVRRDQVSDIQTENLVKYTGNALIDALNVFINQLLITLFYRLMSKLGSKKTTKPYTEDFGLSRFESSGQYSGISGAREYLSRIIQPKFTIRGDYNILAELTVCPDPTKSGPTNCVITDRMRDAIAERKTVGEAVGGPDFNKEIAYLNPEGKFGFYGNGIEPTYIEGYPYRSMIILRKFRILPIGWEVAAEYIHNHPGDSKVGTRNLQDLVSCFAEDDDYEGFYEEWCSGLVDPHWVLKAPLNYCKREGPGPEIIMEQIIGEGSSAKRSVTRKSNYCADEQSCIKERDDGSCDDLYGYCTEERRTWNFDSDSCDAIYNTCQSFKKVDDNRVISFLKNTLEYCTPSQKGCEEYALECDPYNVLECNPGSGFKVCSEPEGRDCENSTSCNLSENVCNWDNDGKKAYFNDNVESCSRSEEGCHKYIRTKSGLGVNLIQPEEIINSGDSKFIQVGPDGYNIGGDTYTLSFAAECAQDDTFKMANQIEPKKMLAGEYFYYTTHTFPRNSFYNFIAFRIGSPGNCSLGKIKLEKGNLTRDDSGIIYSEYGEIGTIYEKILPEYLEDTCYLKTSDEYYKFKDDLTIREENICFKFARKCGMDEAGCELYTSRAENISLPAKVSQQDYCDEQCVGYDTYVQQETNFSPLDSANLIPITAQTCSVSGCEKFTNLDKVDLGGEGIEYYVDLRQCIKPTENEANCSTYYTWIEDKTGPQLKYYTLHSEDTDNGPSPITTNGESGDCKDIYGLPLTDPLQNSDCREFYNVDGRKFYKLYSKTITCSTDCHAYRQDEINIVKTVKTQTECNETKNGNWDTNNNYCVICMNNSRWEQSQGACLYNAIPEQGVMCSEREVGCREYTGSTGANTMNLFNHDFEDNSTQGWSITDEGVMEVQGVSILTGGHSLQIINGRAYFDVSEMVKQNKSYTLSFLIKPDAIDFTLRAYFDNGVASTSDFILSDNLVGDWQFVKVLLPNLDHKIASNERLYLEGFSQSGSNAFYIDDMKLTVVNDRFYLIKDSWKTPAVCDHDHNGNLVLGFALGCEEYFDRDQTTHYLHEFSDLCQESAIGCELVIDTNNSLTALDDKFSFVVYDRNKLCNPVDMGCQRMGLRTNRIEGQTYEDVYIKNTPDQTNIFCYEEGVGCQQWTYGDQNVDEYFKDPGERTCEWKQDEQGDWKWIKRNGEACDISYLKTIGIGGIGTKVAQPAGTSFAGLCPVSASGCTEYIDPVSFFNNNILFNADFENYQDLDDDDVPDGWAINRMQDNVNLDGDTLYRLSRVVGSGNVILECPDTPDYTLNVIDDNNILQGSGKQVKVLQGHSELILVQGGNARNCTITVDAFDGFIELKKVLVSYRLENDIHSPTRESCSGEVNYEAGCILFNERAQRGNKLEPLTLNADANFLSRSKVPALCEGNNCNANTSAPIKVSPNRICDKWLACRSMSEVKDEDGKLGAVCVDVGLCNRVDNDGICNNFLRSEKQVQVKSSNISNMSGYSKVGYEKIPQIPENVNKLRNYYYPFAAMEEVGEVAIIPNGDFEFYKENGYPIGWNWGNQEQANKEWTADIFRVVSSPVETSEIEKIGYAPTGNSYLKVGSTNMAISEDIDVEPGTEYILTAWVNTTNLQVGVARIDIDGTNYYIEKDSGSNWVFELVKIKVPAGVTSVRVRLYARSEGSKKPQGNFYFDNIRLRPALKVRDNYYKNQVCRLYPEDDSLSCNYVDNSGTERRGLYGYCIEYDRYPGSENACLLWYPVDRVKGDSIEEGSGYVDRFPLFYCLEAKPFCGGPAELSPRWYCDSLTQLVTQVGQNKYWASRVYEGSDYVIPFAKKGDGKYIDWGFGSQTGKEDVILNYSRDGIPFGSIIPPDPAYNPYEWDGKINTKDNIKNEPLFVLDINVSEGLARAGTPYYGTGISCERTENSRKPEDDGGPKYFDTKSEGDDYEIYCPKGTYGVNYKDVGNGQAHGVAALCEDQERDRGTSSCPPKKMIGCYYWEGPGPNYGTPGCELTCRADAEYNIADSKEQGISGLKRLFAKSYGMWKWNGDEKDGRYIKQAFGDWNPPITRCPGNSRPAYPSDNCAIPPIIDINNIKINSVTGDVELKSTDFVNLTFTSDVNEQQLPLTMIAIDWGDGDKTVVTGAKMRDRTSVNNPHSFYHLYSYWDLKSKKINCVDDYCRIKPKVKVRDNWNWCSNGSTVNDCANWVEFSGWITVKEE